MPLIDVGWRGMEAIAQPEMEPCPTCGLGVTREPTVTVLRDGRTYHQTILRCPNARKYKAKAYNGSCFAKKNPCAVRKIEHEIKIETEIIDMTRHANPVTRQSQEWIDNVVARRQKLGLTRHALADLAGVPRSTFGKAIAANWGATAATVEAIECALATLEAAEHATAAELLAGETANRNAKADPYAGETAGEQIADDLKLPKTWGQIDGKPFGQTVDDTPHLSSRVSDLSEDQVRFWQELAEATKRLTAIESRLGSAIEGSEGVVGRFTQRLTAIESRLDADNSSHVDKGELSSVLARMQEHTGRLSHQTETAEYSINQLAKSVERIDRDEAANCEKIDNLREDLTAWAGIFEMLSGTIERHKESIGLGQIVTEAHSQRLNALEALTEDLRKNHMQMRAEWGNFTDQNQPGFSEWSKREDAIEVLCRRVESVDNAMIGTIDVLNHQRAGVMKITSRLDATIEMQDDHQKRLSALEGHPSGGESPLWDALDVLTTDVKELRSSYVNRPWAARIEETVEALAAEIRILHSTAATRSWAHETGETIKELSGRVQDLSVASASVEWAQQTNETIRALELRLSCLGKTVETRCCTRPETDPDPPANRMLEMQLALEYQMREIARLKERDNRFALEVIELVFERTQKP